MEKDLNLEKDVKEFFFSSNPHVKEFLSAQKKALEKGLLDEKNLLICTPTASGKTLIAELAGLKMILEKGKKVLYIVPLKALAREKYTEIKRKYSNRIRVSVSSGDLEAKDLYLKDADFIITTSEKLDSLIRHNIPWIQDVGLLVIDEIHLLNDASRGPTLEILIVILRKLIKDIQILGLSATIGNPEELANWLDAELVIDDWRPIKLEKGVYVNGEIRFHKEQH